MLGNTAQNILAMLKGEIGNDMDSAVSPGGDAVLYQQIYNQQNWLQSEYDWPFLRIYQDIQLNFNQRYYPMPTDTEGNQVFQLDRPISAWCYWSSLWSPTDIGITWQDYNIINPDLGMTLVPVKKWQLYQPPTRTYAPLNACTVAAGSAGNLTGNYSYAVTYYTTWGETDFSPLATLTTTATQASLTAIPVSADPNVLGRRIYRTNGTVAGVYYLITTLSNNTATTYTDNTADASLPVLASNNDNTTQQQSFEVWPVPSDGTMKFRMQGQRVLSPFAQPTDRADLDDQLIMLFTAAQFFSQSNPSKSQAAVAKAKNRLDKIVQGYPARNEAFQLDDEMPNGWGRRDWSKQATVATILGGTNASQ